MHRVTTINGDILNTEAQYIAHQCNCRSQRVVGLAALIFEKFPWADITTKGRDVKRFGFIDIRGNGKDQRYVINMFAQVYPGKINEKSILEDENKRKLAFLYCLKQISEIPEIESIAFPYGIGCGLAGGNWEFYERAIEAFAVSCPNTKVYIIRKTP